MLPVSAYGEDDQSIAALRQMGKAFATIAGKASPAVVGIKVTKAARSDSRLRDGSDDGGSNSPLNEDDLFDYFFRRRLPRQYSRPQQKEIAQGSGFVVTADGYILTNNHLVGETEKVSVKLSDGRTMDAKVIGADADSDVAVIKVEADGLPFLELADSTSLEVGEWVIAIGNPFGLSHTVTAGIVSAKGRSSLGVANYEDFIQTDAAINFGNSGGPLLNLDGKVVGINTAIIGPGGNIGIGLAIPINMAKDIYKQLKESGSVVRGFLGVLPTDIEPDMAEFFGLKKDAKGVTEFDGAPVDNANDFRNRVAMHKPGSEVGLVILREGKRMDFTIKLAQKPAGDVASSEQPESPGKLGFTVQALTEDLAQRLGYEGLEGVVVTEVEPGSQADEKRIARGALIREVDRKPVSNVREFKDAVREAQSHGKILLLVRDEGVDRYVVLQQDK
jgi:serine protease Do